VERIRIEHLVPLAKLDRPLYSVTGQLLIARGTQLVPAMIRALELAGTEEAVLLDHPDELHRLQRLPQYERRDIKTIIPGQIITEAMFDEQGALLLRADSVIPAGLVDALKARGVRTVLLYKEPEVDRVSRFFSFLSHEWARELDRRIAEGAIDLRVARRGVPVARRMRIWRGKLRPRLMLSTISRRRQSLLDEASEMLDILRMGAEVKKGRVERIAREMVDLTCDDKDVCLALATFPDAGESLPRITVDVTFIAISMGLMMGYNR